MLLNILWLDPLKEFQQDVFDCDHVTEYIVVCQSRRNCPWTSIAIGQIQKKGSRSVTWKSKNQSQNFKMLHFYVKDMHECPSMAMSLSTGKQARSLHLPLRLMVMGIQSPLKRSIHFEKGTSTRNAGEADQFQEVCHTPYGVAQKWANSMWSMVDPLELLRPPKSLSVSQCLSVYFLPLRALRTYIVLRPTLSVDLVMYRYSMASIWVIV